MSDSLLAALHPTCEVCEGEGRVGYPEVGIPIDVCYSCDGKGWWNLRELIRHWNDTNPKGTFPARAWCFILRHDWVKMDVLEYCSRCRAVWDHQWSETAAPDRPF